MCAREHTHTRSGQEFFIYFLFIFSSYLVREREREMRRAREKSDNDRGEEGNVCDWPYEECLACPALVVVKSRSQWGVHGRGGGSRRYIWFFSFSSCSRPADAFWLCLSHTRGRSLDGIMGRTDRRIPRDEESVSSDFFLSPSTCSRLFSSCAFLPFTPL